jgi:hypothetical protein
LPGCCGVGGLVEFGAVLAVARTCSTEVGPGAVGRVHTVAASKRTVSRLQGLPRRSSRHGLAVAMAKPRPFLRAPRGLMWWRHLRLAV